MTIFNPNPRLQRGVAAALAVGVLGAGAAGGIAAATGGKSPPSAANTPAGSHPAGLAAQANGSTVPGTLKRAETAAEDVITYLEQGKPASSRAEAKLLTKLAHGQV